MTPPKDDTRSESSHVTLPRPRPLALPLAATLAASGYGPPIDPEPPSLDDGAVFTARYDAGELLGEGGMGEVRLCTDKRIGRDVAVKVIRSGQGSRSDLRKRFLREARVQGQLEHPSIVPVYDLGLSPEPAYFTMKRVRGITLEEVIGRLRAGEDPEAQNLYSRRKLLSAFGSVCLAIDFAHSRGVVHRDLKPSNVMLGHFGEVYVLDWGVSKVGDTPDATEPLAIASHEPSGRTEAGALMGTVGYMAPEQLRGETVTPQVDVYALGAILFELLTCTALHTGQNVTDIAASTLKGADARASLRVPLAEVPPELETICVKATATNPNDRYPGARELDLAIERYLDGDRDLEQRRLMSKHHADAALQAAATALDGKGSPEARSVALREVGRALALDATNEEALRTLVGLLVAPPRELPAEASRALEAAQRHGVQNGGRMAIYVYATWFLYAPFLLLMGVRNALPIVLTLGAAALSCALGYLLWKTASDRVYVLLAASNALGVALTTCFFGPLVLAPTIAVAMAASFALDPRRRRFHVTLSFSVLVIVAPLLLEWIGVLPRSYLFERGMMCITPRAVALPEIPSQVALVVLTVASILTVAVFVGRVVVSLSQAEQRLHVHAWQLSQLVPQQARSLPGTSSDTSSCLPD